MRLITPHEVRTLREALRWTQERLAAELGVDRSTIVRAEGNGPRAGTSAAILLLWRLKALDPTWAGPPVPTDTTPDVDAVA